MVTFLAVDFGTTKIAAALFINGKCHTIELGDGREMPSAVYINNSVILFGNDAMKVGKDDPENLYIGLKSLIGRSFKSGEFQQLQKQVPFSIQHDKNGRCYLMVRQNSKRVARSPTDLVSMLLSYVVDLVRKRGYDVDGIMLGYPTSFMDPQIREICAAGARCNVDHVALVSETSAACLFSGITPLLSKGYTLVIECGGGKTDFSVINTTNGEFEVVYTYGLPELGGMDFTTTIMNRVLEDLEARDLDISRMSEKEKRVLREEVENFKIGISSGVKAKDLQFKVCKEDVSSYITESEVKAACHSLLRVCANALHHVLEDMKKRNITFDHVVLSGGGLQLPCLKERLCGMLKNENTTVNNPDSLVRGIVYAARREEANHVPGDGCLLNSLDPETPIPETPIPEMPVPDSGNYYYPVLSSDNAYMRYSVYPSESPVENSEESSDAELWALQHPTSQQSTPDEALLDKEQYTIKEKRAYNIYIKQRPVLGRELYELISKDKTLPFTAEHFPLSACSSDIRVILYEGLEPILMKCTPIREVTFQCDEEHERIIKEQHQPTKKYPKVDLSVTVNHNGMISFKANWKDSNKELKIISDKPVPPDFRQQSQKHLNASAEQSESPISTSQPDNSVNINVRMRQKGRGGVLPTPQRDSFAFPKPPFSVDLPSAPIGPVESTSVRDNQDTCLEYSCLLQTALFPIFEIMLESNTEKPPASFRF